MFSSRMLPRLCNRVKVENGYEDPDYAPRSCSFMVISEGNFDFLMNFV